MWIGIVVGILVIVGAVVAYSVHSNSNGQSQAQTIVNSAYPPVDGVSCDQSEQLAYHIHAHLTMYINGSQVSLPQGVGIAPDSSCYYWLHTHDTTGVIHIESPTQHIYTLGNFFDEWSNEFSSLNFPSQLNLDTSGWTAYVNGKLYTGDFRNIPLNSHTLVTLMYNSPKAKPDTFYDWNAAGLSQ
jgi:hypothetical protein